MTSIVQQGSNLGSGLTFPFPNPNYYPTVMSFDLVSSSAWGEADTNIYHKKREGSLSLSLSLSLSILAPGCGTRSIEFRDLFLEDHLKSSASPTISIYFWREKKWIYTFPKDIGDMWNAENIDHDLNSGHWLHFQRW